MALSNTNLLPTAVVSPIISSTPSAGISDKQKCLTKNEQASVWKWDGNKWIVDTVAKFSPIKLSPTFQPVLNSEKYKAENCQFKGNILSLKSLSQTLTVPNSSVKLDHAYGSRKSATHVVLSKQTENAKHESGKVTAPVDLKNESSSNDACAIKGHDEESEQSKNKTAKSKNQNTKSSSLKRKSTSSKIKISAKKPKKQKDAMNSANNVNLPTSRSKSSTCGPKKSSGTAKNNKKQKVETVKSASKVLLTRLPQNTTNISSVDTKINNKTNPKRCKYVKPASQEVDTTKEIATCYTSFKYSKTVLLKTFPPGITTCSFCQLPANYLPGLGDLFGPFRPTYRELSERYEEAQMKCSALHCNSVLPDSPESSKSEICVDHAANTCYITSSCFKSANNKQLPSVSENPTTSEAEKNIDCMMPRLRMMQTVDCLLTEANKRPAAKFTNSNKIHIPGFTGNITTIGDSAKDDSSRSKRNLLHDLNTIVFVEPTQNLSHLDNTKSTLNVSSESQSPTSSRKTTSFEDGTSIGVVHRFDIKPVWTHAACAAWSPGIYCVQNQLFGVSSAVREARNTTCAYCNARGATIPCRYKRNTCFHYLCSLAQGLVLDEETLSAVEKC